MNILSFVRESFKNMLSGAIKGPTSYKDLPVGAGYYAMRLNVTESGNTYGKLIPRDQSHFLTFRNKLKPQTGMRNPEKRTGRRKAKAIKQIEKEK